MDLVPQNYNRIGLSFREQMGSICSRSAYKPFAIIMTYFLITQLSGVSIFIFWVIEILQKSKSSVNLHVVDVVSETTRIVSVLFCSTLIYKFGRRPLALISGLGVGLICICLGIYIYHAKNQNLGLQICYVAYIIFSTIGHYTLPVLIMFELYPLQIRGILGGISLSNVFFLIFAVNVCYPHVRDLLGFSNTITSFGICSLLGCIYLYFCLPETKGLTLAEIEGYFKEIRPTLTSQRKLIFMQNRSVSSIRMSKRQVDIPPSGSQD